jgi:hypothetical protein
VAKTTDQEKDFSEYARNPDIWVLAARRNLAVTELLMDHRNALLATTGSDFYQSSGCYYASYFHAGLAIENAVKAVLVSSDPDIVKNGRVNVKKFGSRTGHALLGPVQSILGSLTSEERRFLIKLEGFVWAGRYTVPIEAKELHDKKKMDIMSVTHLGERAMLRSLFERLCKQVKESIKLPGLNKK